MLHLNVIEDSRMQPCFKDENKEAPMERSPLHGFGCSCAKPLILVKAGLLLALPVRLMCPTHQKLLFTPNYPCLGALIGVSAALISIITEWLSDIKTGYCRDGWWLNHQFCCWEIETEENICEAWVSWSHYSVFQWLIYVVFAVSDGFEDESYEYSILLQALFSSAAGYLVRSFARYAAGSGISEIKCILAGFVMKGYLGAWTFFIKSLTLVCCNHWIQYRHSQYTASRYCLRSIGW